MGIVMKRGWHAEDIKAAVRKKGCSLKSLALDNKLSESACRASLCRPQPAADRVISEFLGVALHKLWPARYDPDGRRIRARHVRDENKPERAATHRQNGVAR
jgi:Ner family transcriptional regulator